MRDNRAYVWGQDEQSQRPEYALIERWIAPGSRVVDLGCGEGSLLKQLEGSRQIRGRGIELAPSGVAACLAKGLLVTEGAVDEPLPFEDDAFDHAVCNVTIQMVMRPEVLLQQMRRVAHKQIVSFPNFAYLPNRLELLFKGRMPRKQLFGYHWYTTGHIHQLSLHDFEQLAREVGLRVIDTHHLARGGGRCRLAPNLFAYEGIFHLERAG